MTALPTTTVNIVNAPYFIQRCLAAQLVPNLMGQPGGGKSSIFAATAKELSLELIDIRLSTLESVDGNGYPVIDDGDLAYYKPFDLIPLEGIHEIPEGKNGWLVLLDELPQAEPEVIKAFHKVLLDRKIGKYDIHPDVFLATAGNLAKQNAYAQKLGTTIQSRLVTLELSIDPELWVEHVAIPQKMDHRVISYVLANPSSLTSFDPNHTEHTFACPRTMDMLSKLIDGFEVSIEDKALYAGTIGEKHATQFIQYCTVYETLPSKDEVLGDPKGFTLPDTNDKRFALITMLSDWADSDNFDSVVDAVLRFPAQFLVLFARIAGKRDSSILRHPRIADLQEAVGRAQQGR